MLKMLGIVFFTFLLDVADQVTYDVWGVPMKSDEYWLLFAFAGTWCLHVTEKEKKDE